MAVLAASSGGDLAGFFSQSFIRYGLLAGTFIALACGLVGYFLVLRAQVFSSDALGHAAYTGALAALALGIDARVGLFAATVLLGFGLGALAWRRRADDVVIGSVFAWLLGLGALFLTIYTTSHSTGNGTASVNYLFGSIFGLSASQSVTAAVVAGVVSVALVLIARPLLFATLDDAVAAARGVPVGVLGIAFLVLVGVTAGEAAQAVGALLLLGLMAAPGGAAQRLTARPFVGLVISTAIAVSSMWIGMLLSYLVPSMPPSFAILAVATLAYVAAALAARARPGIGRGQDGHKGGSRRASSVSRFISNQRSRIRARRAAGVAFVLAVGLAGCGSGSSTSGKATVALHWSPFMHVPAVVDMTGPRTDGSVVVAAMGRLSLLAMSNSLSPFARGADGYETALGPEPYIALASRVAVPGTDCSFNQDDVYALEPSGSLGVVKIDATGRATRFADLPGGMLPNGIAFDGVGRFGHRLLITATAHGATSVFAIDCHGGVSTLTRSAPTVEGGIAVAPVTFGRFAGDLVAPDELSGRILALGPDGHAIILAKSGLPSGGDIGVESAGFVPAGFGTNRAAYLADRISPGNPHPGNDNILELSGADLGRAGVAAGDLLVASEGGAQTVVVRCASSCTVRHIADGPSTTHGEGHIVFTS